MVRIYDCIEELANVRVIHEIRGALIVVHSAAHKIGLPSKAFSFTTDYKDETTILQLKPNENKNENKFGNYEKGAIGGIESDDGNRDVAALQFLIDDLSKRSEEIRVGIFISDGAPCFCVNKSEDTIKNMENKATRKNIDILCLYVGNNTRGYNCANRMYGNRVILVKITKWKIKKIVVLVFLHLAR